MSTYRKEWSCCDSVTETQAYEPDTCPFCPPKNTALISDDDVRMLYAVARHMSMKDESPKCAADLRNLADRIRTLLPPNAQLFSMTANTQVGAQ